MNVLCIAGNITKDLELRTTNSDKKVVSFGIAITEGKDKTEFVNCVAWEKTAELIARFCNKGDKISWSGKIQTRKWDDKDGNTRYATEMIVFQVDLPPKPREGWAESIQEAGQEVLDSEEIPFQATLKKKR